MWNIFVCKKSKYMKNRYYLVWYGVLNIGLYSSGVWCIGGIGNEVVY